MKISSNTLLYVTFRHYEQHQTTQHMRSATAHYLNMKLNVHCEMLPKKLNSPRKLAGNIFSVALCFQNMKFQITSVSKRTHVHFNSLFKINTTSELTI
jgi:predicted metal-dependent hydrolase